MKTRITTLVTSSLLLALIGCTNIERSSARSSSGSALIATVSKQKSEIMALFDQWNDSLSTGNASSVGANYASDAILIPTVSNKIRRTPIERVDYFEHFLSKKPIGKIDKANVRVFGDIAINSGLYTFTFSGGTKVHARYTFVYRKQPDGKWLIIEHHSSKLPE